MKTTSKPTPQELIKQYSIEVGKYLPAKDRKDIVREIYSTLTDTFEDQSGPSGGTEEDAFALLTKNGHPRRKAASYLPPRYLIGPELFPTFARIVRIVLIAIAASIIGSMILSAFISQGQEVAVWELIANIIESSITGVASAFGIIVLVFIIIEKVNAGPKIVKEMEDWTPKELIVVKKTQGVSLGEQIATIVFAVIIILLLNFYIDRLNSLVNRGGMVLIFPKLTEGFRNYIPYITVQLGLSAVLAVYLIGRREVTLFSKIAGYCLKGFSIAILIGLLTIDRVAEVPAGKPITTGTPPVDIDLVVLVVNNAMKGIFLLIIGLTIYEIVKDIVKTVKGTPEDILAV
jgi:hypothetical protein